MNLPKPRKINAERYVGGFSRSIQWEYLDDAIKMSANESALGPSPKAIQAFEKNKNNLFRYPDNDSQGLRDKIAQTLRKKYGIDTRIAYRMPIYKQKMYKSKNAPFRKLDCKVSEKVTDMILNLPIYPLLRRKEILYIVNSIKKEILST